MAVGVVLILLGLAFLLRTVKGSLPDGVLSLLDDQEQEPETAAPPDGNPIYPGQPRDPDTGKPVLPGPFGDIPVPKILQPPDYNTGYRPDPRTAAALAGVIAEAG